MMGSTLPSVEPAAAKPEPEMTPVTPAVVGAPGVVVVDTARVLDESPAGRVGARALQAAYDDKKARFEKLRDKGTTIQGKRQAEDAAAAFEREAFAELEAQRATLRHSVLDGARPAILAVMAERRAAVVVDTRAAVAFDPAADITDAVLLRLRDA
jgi:Skp family chaperone for outer membrane proteins